MKRLRPLKQKEAVKLRDALVVVGFLIALLGGYYTMTLWIIGGVVMLSALIPHFLFNKCPHCGKNAGRNSGEYCSFCGEKMND